MKTIFLMCCLSVMWPSTNMLRAQESTRQPVTKLAAPAATLPDEAVAGVPAPDVPPAKELPVVELTPEQKQAAEQAEINDQIDAALMRYSNLRSQFGSLESEWLKRMDAILSRYAEEPPNPEKAASSNTALPGANSSARNVNGNLMQAAKTEKLLPLTPSAADQTEEKKTAAHSPEPADDSLVTRLRHLESRVETLEKLLKSSSGTDRAPCAEGDIKP